MRLPTFPLTPAESLALVRQLADPRGRCSRQTFLYVAVAFLALQVTIGSVLRIAGVELSEMTVILLNAPILLIGGTVSVKRVHDIGRRGWIMAGAFAVWLVFGFIASFIAGMMFGPEALAAGGAAYNVLFGAIMLPALGGLLWLHATPGQDGANVFGPVPAEYGLSMPDAGYELSGSAVAA